MLSYTKKSYLFWTVNFWPEFQQAHHNLEYYKNILMLKIGKELSLTIPFNDSRIYRTIIGGTSIIWHQSHKDAVNVWHINIATKFFSTYLLCLYFWKKFSKNSSNSCSTPMSTFIIMQCQTKKSQSCLMVTISISYLLTLNNTWCKAIGS